MEAVSDAGTRVGPKFKFAPKFARVIPCKGVRFCRESKFDLSAMLKKNCRRQILVCSLSRAIKVYHNSNELTKSCTVIGYPSWQDGAIFPICDYTLCPATKVSQKTKQNPYNKYFIDQGC